MRAADPGADMPRNRADDGEMLERMQGRRVVRLIRLSFGKKKFDYKYNYIT